MAIATSQHPVDRLIRELIATRRAATPEEIDQIIDRMATAPFDPRTRRVPDALRGVTYRRHTLEEQEPTMVIHLVQRVAGDGQWVDGTTEAEYLADLRRAVRDLAAGLAVYLRHGGSIAATLTPTENVLPTERRGPDALPWLYVVYSGDRGIIISGYQASGLDTLSIPEHAQWLR